MPNALQLRAAYFIERARVIDPKSILERAKATARQHGKAWPVVLADMLQEAARFGTNFQDYCDWDFALLSNAERRTYVTNAISAFLVEKYNDPAHFRRLEDKVEFNKGFGDALHRDWLIVDESTTEELREFMTRQGKAIAKVPVSNSGYGVDLYRAEDVDDWEAFRAMLLERGQTLLEEYIVQHDALMAVAPGTVNTTRVTSWWDGERMHLLSFAQKFGVGEGASDQQAFGGFFTLLDPSGRSMGPGYGSHQRIYANHPDTGASIVDFQLPMADQVLELCAEMAARIPEVPYIAWDVVVTPTGPVIVEGNRTPGAYENKPSATGRRTGALRAFEKSIGFSYYAK